MSRKFITRRKDVGMIKKIGISAVCLVMMLWAGVSGEDNPPGNLKDTPGKTGNIQMMTFEKGSVTILNELGSIIVGDSGGLVVQMAGPKEVRSEKFKDVDLRDNDRIIMLNGKKVTTIQQFEDGYKAIDVGSDIELGIKRDKIMKIVTLPKASPDELPKMQAMMISPDDGEISSLKNEGGNANITTMSSEGLTGIKPVPGAGIITGEKEGDVVVMMLLPNSGEIFKDDRLEKDDIILSLQGREISTSEQFSNEFKAIPVGSTVSIRYSRDGKTGELSFTRQETSGAMEMKIKK